MAIETDMKAISKTMQSIWSMSLWTGVGIEIRPFEAAGVFSLLFGVSHPYTDSPRVDAYEWEGPHSWRQNHTRGK